MYAYLSGSVDQSVSVFLFPSAPGSVYFSGFVALWSVSEHQFLHGPGYLGLKL